MFEALIRLANTRPRRVLAITALFFAVAGIVGGPVAGVLNADNDSFSDNGASSAQALREIESASGAMSTPDVIVVVELDAEKAMAEVPEVLGTDTAVAQVVGGPEMGPAFVSKDGASTYFAAIYRADADADATTEHLREELRDLDGATVGGFGPAYQQVNEQVESDLVKAELIAFPLLFIASLLVFRSAVSALLPLLVGGLTIVTSLMVLRGVNEVVDVSIFALNLITGLGLGLSIDYSLFLVSRFREELERMGPGPEAVRRTLMTAGRTVLYSALTVAGAGLALLVFPLRFLYSMGIGVTIVALVAAAISLIVLPAIFSVLGSRVNALGLKRWQRALQAEARAEKSGFWYRMSTFVMRFPIGIATAGVLILLVLGAPFLGIKLTGVDASVLPDGAESKQADTLLRTQFVAADVSPFIIAITAPQSAEDEVASYARDIGELDGVESVREPRFLGAAEGTDGTWQVDVLPEGPPLDEASLELVDDVRALDAPGQAYVGGQSAEQVDQVASIKRGMLPGVAILAILTFITLFLMTGSVVLPLKALVMNVLTISATFGILVLVFQDGRFEGLLDFSSRGALNSTQPVFLFAVVFGLSTDYAVFLLTRIKEARDAGATNRESVALGIQRTGRIVTAAAVLFAIALGAFATSEIIFIKELGVGTAVAVLIDATIVRALLVPSLMALLGPANWWAPGPLRRLHDRFGLSEADPEPRDAVSVGAGRTSG